MTAPTPEPPAQRVRSAPRARRALLPAAIAAVLAVLVGAPAAAQDPAPFHWGYGAAFGRGRYTLDDGTETQLYRVIVKPPIRKSADDAGGGDSRVLDLSEDRRGPGVRLILPAAAALLDTPEELLPPGRPADDVQAYSFLPGVELEFAPGERFTLRTSAQGGWGKELEGAEPRARLAALGVRARVQFADAPARPALIAGALWAGVDPSDAARQSILRLTTALEFDVGVPRWQVRGHSMRLLPHVLEDRYRRTSSALSFDAVAGEAVPRNLGSETQIGVAAGRDEPFKIWFVRFNAVGIAYRFSDRSEGIRFYLNSVF